MIDLGFLCSNRWNVEVLLVLLIVHLGVIYISSQTYEAGDRLISTGSDPVSNVERPIFLLCLSTDVG